MNRREFIQCAALLSAGASVVPKGWSLNPEQSEFLAARGAYIDEHTPTFFTSVDRAAITVASEQIIPRTDSPGAIDAGVPRFIELMVSDWLTPAERMHFMAGLAQCQLRADGDLAGLAEADQLTLLQKLEDAAGGAPWFDFANTLRLWDPSAPFICQLKELTVLGFMLSKQGSREFLRANPMGQFDGDFPLAENDGAYTRDRLIRYLAREAVE